jgi:hypothetical protein
MHSRLSGNAAASQSGDTPISGGQTPRPQRPPGSSPSSTLDPRLQGLPRLPSVAELGLSAIPWPAPGGMAPPSLWQLTPLVAHVPVAVARPPASQAVRSSSAVASSSPPTSTTTFQSGMQARNPLGLRPDEIDKISKAHGGRAALACIESDWPALTADSTGGCNSLMESFGRCIEV